MRNGTPSRPPLLVFADDWGRHPSSCQHLIRRLRTEFPVLWVNTVGTRQVKADSFTFRRGLEKLRSWGQGLKQVDERMWVVDVPMLPGLGHGLLRAVNRRLVSSRLRQILSDLGMEAPIVLTTLPYIGWLIRGLRRRGLVYYCTDDYSHYPSADRETLQQADLEMSKEADLVLAASQALLEQHAFTGRCHPLPHGVDVDHFGSVQRQVPDPAIVSLPGPRIGFFGLIYEKLDFGLLGAVAQRFGDGSLVMIGPRDYSPPEFDRLPNVHLLGPKPYDELPRYLAGLDVLLLPYVADDPMIRRSGPLKLRECLASGKPTVGVDVPDVRALEPHVRVAASREEYLEAVRQAVEERPGSPSAGARQGAVAEHSWDARARLLRDHLDALRPGRKVLSPAVNGNGNGHRQPGRVLHLRTVSGRGGGPEKTMLNSQRFLKGKYDLRLAYIRPEGDAEYDMPQRARQMGVDLADIPERSGFDPRTLARLAREVRDFRPDIIHAHDYKTNVLGVLLGRWFGLPVITTMHGYGLWDGRLTAYYQMDRWTLPRMDHVVAVSEDLYERLVTLGLPASRRSLVYNGIDADQFVRRCSTEQAKERAGLAGARWLIGAVGRLTAVKGYDRLIAAVDELLKRGLDVGLVVVGEGEERPRLEAQIAALGRADRVRLLGHRTDVMELYEAMDVTVLSSLHEGLPNVVLESMALGVPVVATRVGAVPQVIADGANGLLVSPGSAEELARALVRLLEDADGMRRLSEAGRETVKARFSFAARMDKIRAIYDALLEKRVGSALRGVPQNRNATEGAPYMMA
jgi:glycosyltransferase involved in cell wall biosynthesis